MNKLSALFASAFCLPACFLVSCATTSFKESVSADDAIVGVSVIGTIGMDGSKPRAIAVEYNCDLHGAKLDLSDFSVTDYGLTLSEKDLNSGKNPGEPVKIYVNDSASVSEKGGTKSGNFVIIELNTDYSVGRYARSYLATMAAGVTQIKDIETASSLIMAGSREVGNYYRYEYVGIDPQSGKARESEYYNYAREGTYSISEIEGYELHMTAADKEKYGIINAKEAFKAIHCFDEANGKYWDFELPYALYVPKDYDANKKYALVLHLHDAGSMDSNPMLTLCESQGAANYASPYFR
ncbi:MAG: hypothetical protein IJ828_10410, partial [Treponema sp.]|nr:hypothetical protein [Treponema sp.]